MNEVHIREPLWIGDRTQMAVGIARFRLLDDMGRPRKGNIRIWIDYKVKDKNDPIDPDRLVLAYKYPFVISCAKALEYPIQVLNDHNRTRLNIIPIADLKVQKTKRKRTMSQSDFKSLMQASNAVKEEENRS
ncbi:MAG: hypothetical protein WC516_08140 [Patescibacteria group bacterium]|jgi:hypothetical protein